MWLFGFVVLFISHGFHELLEIIDCVSHSERSRKSNTKRKSSVDSFVSRMFRQNRSDTGKHDKKVTVPIPSFCLL